jgi:hypothetical protein
MRKTSKKEKLGLFVITGLLLFTVISNRRTSKYIFGTNILISVEFSNT